MKLIFATNNQHKLKEIKALVNNGLEILNLSEIGCTDDIPETGTTIESNASQKSFFIFNKFGVNCFADDTGLEIEALNGSPGVFSARYAGEECCFEKNIDKVLKELEGVKNRKACFRTVISLIINGKEKMFVGRVDGDILTERHGKSGFGYDPIFRPEGYDITFAEMTLELKNSISHRGKAIQELIEYLKTIKK